MKKTLVALAALAATASFAQSAVTLYGTLDASMISISNGNKAVVGTAPAASQSGVVYADSAISSSVWGLRGSEDLGGGMKAIFNVEGDIQTNNGGMNHNGIFRRAANVGLSGNFGIVELGVKVNPLIATNGALAPLGGNSVMTSTASSLGYADFYTKNAITYTTPTISGFTGQLQYGDSNNLNSATDGSVTAYSLAYVNGPWLSASPVKTVKKLPLVQLTPVPTQQHPQQQQSPLLVSMQTLQPKTLLQSVLRSWALPTPSVLGHWAALHSKTKLPQHWAVP